MTVNRYGLDEALLSQNGRLKNGQLPADVLAPIPGDAPTRRLRRGALASWLQVCAEFNQKGQGKLLTNDSYRTLAEQQHMKDTGQTAVAAGKSNHGWGIALDVAGMGVRGNFSSSRRKIFADIAQRHGWNDTEGRDVGEPWHWDFTGQPDQAGQPAPPPVQDPPSGLAVNGYLDAETIKALQRRLGTPVDGVISSPSKMVKALQAYLNSKGMNAGTEDGYLGKNTISALQRYLGTPVDGVISKPSMMVRALQTRLNQGTF